MKTSPDFAGEINLGLNYLSSSQKWQVSLNVTMKCSKGQKDANSQKKLVFSGLRFTTTDRIIFNGHILNNDTTYSEIRSLHFHQSKALGAASSYCAGTNLRSKSVAW